MEFADQRVTDYENDDKIPKYLKMKEYKKDDSVIRIKVVERFYRWWIRTSNEFRNAVIPLFGCVFFTLFIYNLSVFLYEKEENVFFFYLIIVKIKSLNS